MTDIESKAIVTALMAIGTVPPDRQVQMLAHICQVVIETNSPEFFGLRKHCGIGEVHAGNR